MKGQDIIVTEVYRSNQVRVSATRSDKVNITGYVDTIRVMSESTFTAVYGYPAPLPGQTVTFTAW